MWSCTIANRISSRFVINKISLCDFILITNVLYWYSFNKPFVLEISSIRCISGIICLISISIYKIIFKLSKIRIILSISDRLSMLFIKLVHISIIKFRYLSAHLWFSCHNNHLLWIYKKVSKSNYIQILSNSSIDLVINIKYSTWIVLWNQNNFISIGSLVACLYITFFQYPIKE